MRYEEQIISKDRYPSTFSSQMEAIVFIILQILIATHAVLKIGEYLVNKPLPAAGIFNNYPAKSRGISSDT